MLDATVTTLVRDDDTDPDTTAAALRDRVQLVISGGKSQNECSKESGVGYTSFNSWLNNKYTGNNAEIAAKVERWLDNLAMQTRKRAVMPQAPGFVETNTAITFLNALEHAQTAPEFVVISGAPGIGKTTTAREYARRKPNVWIVTAQPCYRTPRALMDEIAEVLALPRRQTAQQMSRGIQRRIAGTNGLLIVDEAQHLTTETLDQLRSFHDEAEIGVALIGNETVYARIEGTGRGTQFAQLFSRVGLRIQRAKPTKVDIDAILRAWRIEGSDEKRILRAIAGKPGGLRNLTKTLRLAHMLASGDEEQAPLTENLVLMAWQQISNERVAL